jgi:ABC-type multidrug transport system ATPase subunit
VDDVTIGFDVGCTALIGPNGAGKTSLISALAGLLTPTSGTLVVDGEAVSDKASVDRLRRRSGHLSQGGTLPRNFTVAEVMAYAAWLMKVPAAVSTERQSWALDQVGLSERAGDRVRALSGGMRQRLGIAQALVNRPDLLLLDEPTVGLDPEQRADFRRTVSALAVDTTVLLSTHIVDDVTRLCDRAVVLDQGKVLFNGTIEQMCGIGERADVTADLLESAYLKLVRS